MEPAVERREHSSRFWSRLNSVNGWACERCLKPRLAEASDGLVKVRKQPLSCMRALAGVGLTTSALALTRLQYSWREAFDGGRGTGSVRSRRPGPGRSPS